MANNTANKWFPILIGMFGALFFGGCASTQKYDNLVVNSQGQVTAPVGSPSNSGRPSLLNGECKYFQGGGGLTLINANGLRENEVVNWGLYDSKVPEARVMVTRREASEATKAALGLVGDPRHVLVRRAGDPLHGNFYVERRWWNKILWVIPDPRKAKVWFGIGPLDGAAVIDNDPDDGIAALGYDYIDTESGPDRATHLEHLKDLGFTADPPEKRLFKVLVAPQPANQAQATLSPEQEASIRNSDSSWGDAQSTVRPMTK